jgi:hypothetical protein
MAFEADSHFIVLANDAGAVVIVPSNIVAFLLTHIVNLLVFRTDRHAISADLHEACTTDLAVSVVPVEHLNVAVVVAHTVAASIAYWPAGSAFLLHARTTLQTVTIVEVVLGYVALFLAGAVSLLLDRAEVVAFEAVLHVPSRTGVAVSTVEAPLSIVADFVACAVRDVDIETDWLALVSNTHFTELAVHASTVVEVVSLIVTYGIADVIQEQLRLAERLAFSTFLHETFWADKAVAVVV